MNSLLMRRDCCNMGSNLDAPVISCKRGFKESLSFLPVLLLELLVVWSALVKGEALYVVIVNSAVFLLFLFGWIYLSQMRVKISFEQKVLVMCVYTMFFRRIRYLNCEDGVVVCLAKHVKLFPRRVRLSFVSASGMELLSMPFSIPYSKGVSWCGVINDYISGLKANRCLTGEKTVDENMRGATSTRERETID